MRFLIYYLIGSAKIVKLLIEKGANINAVTEDKNSALILAVLNGNILQNSVVSSRLNIKIGQSIPKL